MPELFSRRSGVVLPVLALRCARRTADTGDMAVEKLPDHEALGGELAHLRHRQRDLLRQHDKLTERMLEFPNEFGLAWGRSLAAEIQRMAGRIAELEAQLLFRGS
jgi:hypothetical protein